MSLAPYSAHTVSPACLCPCPQHGLCCTGMSGTFVMQELKYFWDEATLMLTLEALPWFSSRRSSHKGVRKWDEELQRLMSSGQMIQPDEKLHLIISLRIADRRGGAAHLLRRHSDLVETRPPSSSLSPRQCCLLASFFSKQLKLTSWKMLTLNKPDFLSFVKKDPGFATQWNAVTKSGHNRIIVFCDEDTPLQLFGDPVHTEDCRTSFIRDSSWSIGGNELNCLKNFSGHRNHSSNTSNCGRDSDDTCNPESLKGLSGKDKKRKSVSFADDVMVYLFDQESPDVELHSGLCTSLPSSDSSSFPDVLEDSGLEWEWEDDFSALEKSRHFQFARQPISQHDTLSQSQAALTSRFFLSQTCLFLTCVTESDLEL